MWKKLAELERLFLFDFANFFLWVRFAAVVFWLEARLRSAARNEKAAERKNIFLGAKLWRRLQWYEKRKARLNRTLVTKRGIGTKPKVEF